MRSISTSWPYQVAAWACVRRKPHEPQNRLPWLLTCAHCGHVTVAAAAGAAATGAGAGAGVGAVTMTNPNGVVLNLQGLEAGFMASLNLGGLTIALK